MSSALLVAIVGGGLGGLLVAQKLSLEGVPFVLFESDADATSRRQGYRITLDRHGLGAMRRCLPDHLFRTALAAAGEPGGYFRILCSDLRSLLSVDFSHEQVEECLRSRQVDRAVLRAILMRGLEEKVIFGKKCVRIEQCGDHRQLHFSDGTTASANLVIGADGAHSAVRNATDQAPLEDLGVVAWYGKTKFREGLLPEWLDRSGMLVIGNPGRAFFATAMRFQKRPHLLYSRLGIDATGLPDDDYIMWALALRRDPINQSPAGVRDIPQAMIESFDPALRKLVAEADALQTISIKMEASRRARKIVEPGVVLLGDAAHLMPPFGAHGGNTALKDAGDLGACFEGWPSSVELSARLHTYQTRAMAHGYKQVRTAKFLMRVCLSRNPLMRLVLLTCLPLFQKPTSKVETR